MLVAALTCLAFIVSPSTSSPLPVPPSTHQKNTPKDLIYLEEYDPSSSNEQKLNAPPFQCKAPPCTPSRILHRAKRTIDLFPFSLLKVIYDVFIHLNILDQMRSNLIRNIFRWACLGQGCRSFLMLPSVQTTMHYLSELIWNWNKMDGSHFFFKNIIGNITFI